MVGLLEFGRRNVAERFEQAAAVVPRDPLEGRELDVLEPLPRPATMDLLRLEQPDHGLCQRVVVRVTGAADRRLDARLGQPLRVPNRQILGDRKSTRLNSSHSQISYAVFCLKKKKKEKLTTDLMTYCTITLVGSFT